MNNAGTPEQVGDGHGRRSRVLSPISLVAIVRSSRDPRDGRPSKRLAASTSKRTLILLTGRFGSAGPQPAEPLKLPIVEHFRLTMRTAAPRLRERFRSRNHND